MTRLVVVLMSALALAAAVPVAAQQPKDNAKKKSDIPADARPPRGMCRIWIDGVPAAQQPAATDCQSAVKNRPANGRVIFGDDFDRGQGRGPAQAAADGQGLHEREAAGAAAETSAGVIGVTARRAAVLSLRYCPA